MEGVGKELSAGNDDLSIWAKARGKNFFRPPDEPANSAMKRVALWARKAEYEERAIREFLEVADYFLVSQALADGDVVVTHERRDNTKRKIKIPNACAELGVECITPLQMLRRERARFVLGEFG